MQLTTPTSPFGLFPLRTSAGTGALAGVTHPVLDPIVEEQARFRLEGSGPLTGRGLVPVTAGARELLGIDAAGTERALRSVLRLVEDSAGGAARSAGVRLTGIALTDSPDGLGAATYRAHLDGDASLAGSYATAKRATRDAEIRAWGTQAAATNSTAHATVVGGWMNLGAGASGTLLARQGVHVPGMPASAAGDELGVLVRVLRHETEHVLDPTEPGLDHHATFNVREALAESHSTTLPQLQRARASLGLSAADVSDAQLSAAIVTQRPYASIERGMAEVLTRLGFDATSGAALLTRPSSEVVGELVRRVAAADHVSAGVARDRVAEVLRGFRALGA